MYERPWYLSGAWSRSTTAPSSAPISPTAELKPPAPQSVIAWKSPRSRAWRITSSTIFSVIALPICTAPPEIDSLSPVSSAELKVAPWMPSRPVRPPMATIRSPGSTFLNALPRGQDADGAAEDQRVGQVARVDGQGAVDRGDAHAVAVVAHAGDDALRAPAWVEHARREAGRAGRSGGATQKTSVLQIGLAPRPVPRASRITPPRPVFDAAVGVDGRGVVVRLDLEADVVLVVEPDHAGVVGEDAHQPVEVQGLGRGEDRLLEQVVDRPALELDPPLERLVRAVLAPGLGQGLELAVGRVAAELGEMAPGSTCISARLSESCPDLLSCDEGRVVHRADRDGHELELVVLPLAEVIERQGADDRLLDRVVGQHALDQPGEMLGGPADAIAPDGPHPDHVEAEVAEQLRGALGLGVGHARLGQDVDDGLAGRRRGAVRVDLERLDDRVDQHLAGRTVDVGRRHRAFDQETAAGRDRPGARETRLGRLDREPPSGQVGMPGSGLNFKMPEHALPVWLAG